MSSATFPIPVSFEETQSPQRFNMNVEESVQSFDFALGTEIRSGTGMILYGTMESWAEQPTLIAKKKTIYVYVDYDTTERNGEIIQVPGIKIGDGTSYLIDMPFVSEGISKRLLDHINNQSIHVSEYDRLTWNNKVSVRYAGEERIVFENGLVDIYDGEITEGELTNG